uniref:Glucosylceramidase n=1 Tax=Acrobeloides nanus TaxID=290746 RepID=A0A914E4V4_9BILA
MKTNNDDEHGGTIKGDIATGPYWKTWANYFVRYFEEYSKNNITFWGVTMQNEPQADQNFQSLVLNSTQERDFTKLIWGPTLRSNSITKNLKLMVLDHNRDLIPDFVPTIFGDPDATSLLDGLAVHWYMDTSYGTYGNVAPGILTWAHDNYLGPKNKFLLYTEACNEGRPAMGLWLHGDKYMNDIINSLNNWAVGWVEWNLVVDPTGGPNWVNNDVDQSIIAFNSSYDGNGERFEKQPMFYAMGHFSKFIVPNSTIIDHKLEGTTYADSVLAISAQRPDGLKVVVINNRDLMPHNVSVINKWGAPLNLMLEPQSWTTIVYNDTVSLGSSGSTSSGTVQRLPSFWGLLGFLSVLFLSK